jgi:hypothetical protein
MKGQYLNSIGLLAKSHEIISVKQQQQGKLEAPNLLAAIGRRI